MLIEDSHCICLSVVLTDTVFKMGKNCYPKAFLEECGYISKDKKIWKYISDDLETLFDDSIL